MKIYIPSPVGLCWRSRRNALRFSIKDCNHTVNSICEPRETKSVHHIGSNFLLFSNSLTDGILKNLGGKVRIALVTLIIDLRTANCITLQGLEYNPKVFEFNFRGWSKSQGLEYNPRV